MPSKRAQLQPPDKFWMFFLCLYLYLHLFTLSYLHFLAYTYLHLLIYTYVLFILLYELDKLLKIWRI